MRIVKTSMAGHTKRHAHTAVVIFKYSLPGDGTEHYQGPQDLDAMKQLPPDWNVEITNAESFDDASHLLPLGDGHFRHRNGN